MKTSEELQKRFIELYDGAKFRSRNEAVKLMGITDSTLVRLYNEGYIPKISVLIRIADYFNVTMSYILGLNDKKLVRSNENRSFSYRILLLMNENNIGSLYELGDKVGIHRNVIGQWLKKKFLPELNNLQIVADYFGVSLDFLLGRTDDRQ